MAFTFLPLSPAAPRSHARPRLGGPGVKTRHIKVLRAGRGLAVSDSEAIKHKLIDPLQSQDLPRLADIIAPGLRRLSHCMQRTSWTMSSDSVAILVSLLFTSLVHFNSCLIIDNCISYLWKMIFFCKNLYIYLNIKTKDTRHNDYHQMTSKLVWIRNGIGPNF